MYRLPPLTWLRAFEAAARSGSFTAAARELNLTQAAVSHQVRSLEKHLGFPLFERLARSLRLSDMGKAYLPSVRKAFDELSASTAGLFGPVGERAVTVRAPISFAVLWLAPRLGGFLQAFPDIDVRLFSALWADALPAEEADIDIRLGGGRWPGLQAELIMNEGALPVCSEAFAAANAPLKTPADLAGKPLIQIMGFEDLWMRFFRSAGLESGEAEHGIKVDTSLAALELAAAGSGCALVQRSFARHFAESGRLTVPVERELPLEESHYLVGPEGGGQPKPEALLFRDWLLEEARATA